MNRQNKQAMREAVKQLNALVTKLNLAGASDELVEMLEEAGVVLEQEAQAEERKWHVYDKFDALGEFDTVAEAADYVGEFAAGAQGVHILHLTQSEHLEYCNKGAIALAGVISE